MSKGRPFSVVPLDKDPSLKPVYDKCITAILDDRAQVQASTSFLKRPVLYIDGHEILEYNALTYYLLELDNVGFSFEKARDFSEKMRKLFGFGANGWGFPLLSVLEKWVDFYVQYPYFYADRDSVHYYQTNWHLKEGEPHEPIIDGYFEFACYVAISHLKYGADYMSITTNNIFYFITILGSDLPAQLKKHGSGDIPNEILEYKDKRLSCKANDAFATIKIIMKEESKTDYEKTLDFLIRLLEMDFPRSYSIDFRSPEKNYLPIKKLPKKGINQLFANSVQHSDLHGKIEQYARLAMREYEWYTNLDDIHCAMPGTFAVFALGLLDEAYHSLVIDYIKICDGEHQQLHGEFVLAYIEKYGFTEKGIELYALCEQNIQELPKKLVALHKKMK